MPTIKVMCSDQTLSKNVFQENPLPLEVQEKVPQVEMQKINFEDLQISDDFIDKMIESCHIPCQKKAYLKELDLMIIDNSLR